MSATTVGGMKNKESHIPVLDFPGSFYDIEKKRAIQDSLMRGVTCEDAVGGDFKDGRSSEGGIIEMSLCAATQRSYMPS